jgi:hypothetical protein
LPSAENVAINGTIFGDIFTTSTFGGWCAGRGCNGDIGINGVWAAVPEPGTLALFLSGLFGAALLGRRRRRAVSV